MPHRSMTFAKFIIEDQRRRGGPDTELTALLNDVQTACKLRKRRFLTGDAAVMAALVGTRQ